MNPFTRYLPALEATMRQAIPDAAPEALYGMLRYHLGWVDTAFQPTAHKAGKRLRPIFLLLACEAQVCGTQSGDWQRALPAAAAIELLHNFTLIHDDIEDRDRTRRGRPTLWAIWGEPQAINAGDALFTLAYRSLFNLQTTGIPPETVLRAVNLYTDAILHITEGQHLDLSFEGENEVDEATYLTMIQGKTAMLLGLACELGGLLAGASESAPGSTARIRRGTRSGVSDAGRLARTMGQSRADGQTGGFRSAQSQEDAAHPPRDGTQRGVSGAV